MRKIISGLLLIITIACGENHMDDSSLNEAIIRTGEDYNQPEYIDSIRIYVSDKRFTQITEKRERALFRGQLMSEDNDWVPATIIYSGDTLRAELRLKGDLHDHWGHQEEWSFKVNVRDGRSVRGMKRFAIQRPKTRSFLNEWILHELLKYNGLIALNYDFIKLSLNGKPFPVYAIEENFDKRLIERNEQREGITFRFDRGFFWYHDPGLNDAFYSCLIRPYQANKTLRTTALRDQYYIVRNLIEEFRKGNLTTADVFDSEKLANSFAILDLTGHHHASALDNLKFYYNPVTSLIEPIVYDNQDFLSLENQGLLGENKGLGERYEMLVADHTHSYWYQHLFMDEVFFRDYIGTLERISKKEYLDEFIKSVEHTSRDKIEMLQLSYPEYEFSSYNVLYDNQNYIQQLLDPVCRFRINTGTETASLSSTHNLPLQVLSFIISDQEYIDAPIVLPPVPVNKAFSRGIPISYGSDNLKTSKGSTVQIEYQVLGTSHIITKSFELHELLKGDITDHQAKALRPKGIDNWDKYDLQGLARNIAARDLLGYHHITDIEELIMAFRKTGNSTSKVAQFNENEIKELKPSIPSYEILGVRDYRIDKQYLLKRLFDNVTFYKYYVRSLEEISDAGFFERDDVLKGYESLYTCFDKQNSSKRHIIKKNQNYLWKYLNPVKAIHVHFEGIDEESEKLFLRVSNAHKLTMEVLDAVAYKDWVFQPVQNAIIEGTHENALMNYEIIQFKLPERFADSFKKLGAVTVDFPWELSMLESLQLNYRIYGSTRSKVEEIHPFQRFDNSFYSDDFIRNIVEITDNEQVNFDRENRKITIKNGEWEVSGSVKVPKGYSLVIEEGAFINLVKGAMILSYSPVIAIGREGNPIRIESNDGTGQGLSIIGAEAISEFEYVSFKNLASPKKNGWTLSGSVNFYESNVNINNCSFAANNSEDALNIIRSNYTLVRSKFIDISSDAVDLDFSTGTVSDTRFESIGNDALDISGGGANVLSDIQIMKCGDKGISIGEGAMVMCDELSVENTEIAIAVKDKSEAKFVNLHLANNRLGFAGFEKKSEYGGSSTYVDNLTLDNVLELYLLEGNSRLVIDKTSLMPNSTDVAKQLYGNQYGKGSASAVQEPLTTRP